MWEFLGPIGVGLQIGSLIQGRKASEQAASIHAANAEQSAAEAELRQRIANMEAAALEVQSGQAVAIAQREALDIMRAGELAASRAQALAAASGGGATAPTVLRIIGGIYTESAYNAGRAMYAGEEQARLFQLQARAKREGGEFSQLHGAFEASSSRARAEATRTAGSATLLSQGAALFERYAPKLFSGGGGRLSGGVDLGTAGSGDLMNLGYA